MKKYKSKIDIGLIVFDLIVAFIIIVSLMRIVSSKNLSLNEVIILVVIYISIIPSYYFAIVYPIINTQYVLHNDCILIKSGFYKKSFKIANIIEIKQIKSIKRAPALSTNRLHLIYQEGNILETVEVSPNDKESFLKDIENRRKV